MNQYSSSFLNYGETIPNSRNSVVRATHKETGEELIVKTMPMNIFSTREIEVLTSCTSHQNIVSVYSIEQIFKSIVIVMKREVGGNLVDLLLHGPLPESEARDIFLQLVEVVSFLHYSDIAHRDIKLDNILLNENKDVILIDFEFSSSIANAPDDETSFCGTAEYSSPEVRFRKRPINPAKLDVWSLGVVLYALVTGQFPFNSADLKKKSPSLKIPSYVSDDCRNLLKQLLQSDPAKRPDMTSIILHNWLSAGFSPAKKQQRAKIIRSQTDKVVPSISKEIATKLSDHSLSKSGSCKGSGPLEYYDPEYTTSFQPEAAALTSPPVLNHNDNYASYVDSSPQPEKKKRKLTAFLRNLF